MNSIIKKQREEIILSNEVVQVIKSSWDNRCNSLFLTGGAVIDLLEGRIPKDYDLYYSGSYDPANIIKEGLKMGFTFGYTSATAVTFFWRNNKIQILRKSPVGFPFTIESSRFSIKKGEFESFDELSFERKTLIPNDFAFTNKLVSRKEFQIRIKKWKSKGYTINPITKNSYSKLTTNTTFWGKVMQLFFSNESSES